MPSTSNPFTQKAPIMPTALEKIDFINSLQGQTITSLSFELVTVNGQVLPDWLTATFAPEFKKEFARILRVLEKQLQNVAEAELILQIEQTEAQLDVYKDTLRGLRRP